MNIETADMRVFPPKTDEIMATYATRKEAKNAENVEIPEGIHENALDQGHPRNASGRPRVCALGLLLLLEELRELRSEEVFLLSGRRLHTSSASGFSTRRTA